MYYHITHSQPACIHIILQESYSKYFSFERNEIGRKRINRVRQFNRKQLGFMHNLFQAVVYPRLALHTPTSRPTNRPCIHLFSKSVRVYLSIYKEKYSDEKFEQLYHFEPKLATFPIKSVLA